MSLPRLLTKRSTSEQGWPGEDSQSDSEAHGEESGA